MTTAVSPMCSLVPACAQFVCDAQKILAGLFTFSGVTQDGRRVIDCGEVIIFPLNPLSMLSCDPIIGRQDALGGNPAETDDDLRPYQKYFIFKIRGTAFFFAVLRVAVAWRMAL